MRINNWEQFFECFVTVSGEEKMFQWHWPLQCTNYIDLLSFCSPRKQTSNTRDDQQAETILETIRPTLTAVCNKFEGQPCQIYDLI